MSHEFPPNMPSDIRSAFEGLDPPTGPPVPVIAMLELVQALFDYRALGQSGPEPTRILMSPLARKAYLAELVRRGMVNNPETKDVPGALPVVLDPDARGFMIRLE